MGKEIRKIVGVIEATGPYTMKSEGKETITEYSTIRLRGQDGQQIFLDRVQAAARVSSLVAPGLAGTFYMAPGRSLIFAYRSEEGELVHDLSGVPKSLWTYRLLALGVLVFMFFQLKEGYGALGTLIWFSPVWLIGLIAGIQAIVVSKRLALARKELGPIV